MFNEDKKKCMCSLLCLSVHLLPTGINKTTEKKNNKRPTIDIYCLSKTIFTNNRAEKIYARVLFFNHSVDNNKCC